MVERLLNLFSVVLLLSLLSSEAFGACGGTVITASTTGAGKWSRSSSWNPANIPNATTEDAVVIAGTRDMRLDFSPNIGCFTYQSGGFECMSNNTVMTINGDYFREQFAGGTINCDGTTNNTIRMAGVAAQTFEAVNAWDELDITNATTVTFSTPFALNGTLSLNGGVGSKLIINADFTLNNTALTIPAGVTVEVANSATLFAMNGITVNGTLKIQAGSRLVLGNGTTLAVNAGAVMQVTGAPGNVAKILVEGAGNTFTWNMDGTLSMNYFYADRIDASGLNIGGAVTTLKNGEFHNVASAGAAITIGAGATSIPGTMDSLGFYDDGGYANNYNIDANGTTLTSNLTTYAGTVNNGGGLGEGSDRNDSGCGADPPGCISWGSAAAIEKTVLEVTPSGNPTASIIQSSGDVYFSTFALALTGSGVATNITEITLTNGGTSGAGDLSDFKIFKDDGTTACVYDGSDTQIGTLTLLGNPAKATLTGITAGDIQTSSATQACFHVTGSTSATAADTKTIQLKIAATADIVTDGSYNFSVAGSPPLQGGVTSIIGDTTYSWSGSNSTDASTAGNWLPAGGPPTTADDCIVGVGQRTTQLVGNLVCQNLEFRDGGTIDFNGADFQVSGNLFTEDNVTYTNAAARNFNLVGTSNQVVELDANTTGGGAFPGNLIVNNTGAASNNYVDVSLNSEIAGGITVTAGILRINTGVTLTVGADITCNGGQIEVQPGAKIAMANATTMTINAGCTLKIVGTSSQVAVLGTDGASSYSNYIINGTVQAQYYQIDHMADAGFQIASAATIDATYHLQNGSFTDPQSNSTIMLDFNAASIPSNTLDSMFFDTGASSFSTATNMDSTGMTTAATLGSWSGDLGGAGNEVDTGCGASPNCLDWQTQVNTINILQEIPGATTNMEAGSTYNMGTYSFKQTLNDNPGGTFNDADITTLKLTLFGTGNSGDVQAVKILQDTDCDGAGGVQIGSGTFSGLPATKTFTIAAGALTVAAADPSVKNCVYVELDVALAATDGSTLQVKIDASTDMVNDQGYTVSGGTPAPVTLGTERTVNGASITVWTGSVDSVWETAGNWSAGVPDATKVCEIDDVANDPVITLTSGTCKSINSVTGIISIGILQSLTIENNVTLKGTVSGLGTFELTSTSDTNFDVSATIPNLSFNKGGGTVTLTGGSAGTITNAVSLSSGETLSIPNGQSINFTGGLTIPTGAAVSVDDQGTLIIGSGATLSVTGGSFTMAGTSSDPGGPLGNKATLKAASGTFGFNATSGTVSLVGFDIQAIDTSGFRVNGSTVLSNLTGGRFTAVPNTFPRTVLDLNTTGSIPATANWIGWDFVSIPLSSESYTLVDATSCGSQTMNFTAWSGNWYETVTTFDVSTKINDSPAPCTINLQGSSEFSSPVSLISFTAVPYNAAVDLRWETSFEQNHAGFNVYRANDDGSEFIQINNELLKNFNNSLNNNGIYRFIDNDVVNDNFYNYYIEDIAHNGDAVLHGPRSAKPLATLGAPPADSGENSGQNANQGAGAVTDPATIKNPSFKDLGNGIVILSQTSTSLRLKITPTNPIFSASAWNGAYEDVAIEGFSKILNAGSPEILERVLLIEVQSFATNATVENISVNTEQVLASHNLSPVPTWAADGAGVLQPSYSENAISYATNSYSPSVYHNVDTTLVSVGTRKFIKITVNPLQYNAVTDNIKHLQEMTLDIGLNGDAWQTTDPTGDFAIHPSIVPNTLRIHYNKAGIYEVTYADLLDSSVEGPFTSALLDDLRLYYQGSEIPFEIIGSGPDFGPGDKIRFYGPFNPNFEDDKDEVVLTDLEIGGDGSSPLRMSRLTVDPTPHGNTSTANSRFSIQSEIYDGWNEYHFLDNEPVGEYVNHLYLKRLISPNSGLATEYYDFVFAMSDLDPTSAEDVIFKVYIKGGKSYYAVNSHHVEVRINGGAVIADKTWQGLEPTVLTFSLPATNFVSGSNTIRLRNVGDNVSTPVMINGTSYNDYSFLYLEKTEVEYSGSRNATSGRRVLKDVERDAIVTTGNFTTNSITGYDVTDPLNPSLLVKPSIVLNGATFDYQSYFHGGNHSSSNLFELVEDANILKPINLSLTPGHNQSLKDPNRQADLLVIGEQSLLNAASELIAHRENGGLEVATVTLDQIYAEFNNGLVSSKAIQDFVRFTISGWSYPKPQYLLILGDGNVDPRDLTDWGKEVGDTPMPLVSGEYIDFGTDNFFVEPSGSFLPSIAVGRIPTNSPEAIYKYAQKVINYESGSLAPAQKNLVFVSGSPLSGERSDLMTSFNIGLSGIMSGWNTQHLDESTLTAATTNTSLLSLFSDSSFLINYTGHGAPNIWSNLGDVLDLTDVANLNNSKLPIVTSFNCENALFYDPDKSTSSLQSIGVEMILNEESGAIVFMGSTAQTATNAQNKLATALFNEILAETNKVYNGDRLGDLFLRAKVTTGNGNFTKDIVRSFSIIGDPTLVLPSTYFAPPPTSIPNPVAGGGGGGCSAAASDGQYSKSWPEGFLEILALFLFGFTLRKGQKFFFS